MKNFMTHDFTVSKIELAILVKAGTGAVTHKNRNAHGLAIFPDGERIFHFEDRTLKVTKNTIVYFPKGSNYIIKETIPSDCYAINFQMPDDISFEPFSIKVKNLNLFLEHFKCSQRIWLKKQPGYTSKVKSELYAILYNMQYEYSIPYSKSGVIQPALDYIHANYHQKAIRIPYLAELCGISTVHLTNTFVKLFAVPPIQYINSLKLARAKELLTSGMHTVKEACILSGYNDESYFSREFKKHFGSTPSSFVKSIPPDE